MGNASDYRKTFVIWNTWQKYNMWHDWLKTIWKTKVAKFCLSRLIAQTLPSPILFVLVDAEWPDWVRLTSKKGVKNCFASFLMPLFYCGTHKLPTKWRNVKVFNIVFFLINVQIMKNQFIKLKNLNQVKTLSFKTQSYLNSNWIQ